MLATDRTRGTAFDGAHYHEMPVYTPVTDDNDEPRDEVVDAEPDADVHIRPDRPVCVGDSRHIESYHLFPDCHLLGIDVELTHMGEVWQEGLELCDECQQREKVRAVVSDDEVPPNPDPDSVFLPGEAADPAGPKPTHMASSAEVLGRWIGDRDDERVGER